MGINTNRMINIEKKLLRKHYKNQIMINNIHKIKTKKKFKTY